MANSDWLQCLRENDGLLFLSICLMSSCLVLLLICLHAIHRDHWGLCRCLRNRIDQIAPEFISASAPKCICFKERDEQVTREIDEALLRINRITLENIDLKECYKQVTRERDEALLRLSEIMGSRLSENNPDIVHLNDKNRPTKLAEISSELYDNEWTDACDVLENAGFLESQSIRILLDIIMVSYLLCQEWSNKEWEKINNWLGDRKDNTSRLIRHTFKEEMKAIAGDHLKELRQTAVQKLCSIAQDEKLLSLMYAADSVQKYMDKCVSTCIHMVVQDPPVVWHCPGWRSEWFALEQTSPYASCSTVDHWDEKFETKLFRPYLTTGQFVEYIVWPALLRHNNGPLLEKGVAEGCNAKFR